MRIVFLLAVLVGGVFYSYIAFTDLPFLSRTGRLGPGFFPRIIGGLIVVLSILSIASEIRRRSVDEHDNDHARVVVLVMVLAGGYVASLSILGGILATFVFLLVSLSLLNPGRWVQNVIVSLVLPAFIYLLFDVLLNAAMPRGILNLPI